MGVQGLDETLSALADPSRRRVVDVLRAGPRRASELATDLQMSRPAMSRHLRVLRQRGLVSVTGEAADARARIYQLEPGCFLELSAWLNHVASLWGEQLDAFKAHVERDDL
ncbi:MAG: metalloregulator ArsR/SmtB family transcription factor [Myxococcota bacterium]